MCVRVEMSAGRGAGKPVGPARFSSYRALDTRNLHTAPPLLRPRPIWILAAALLSLLIGVLLGSCANPVAPSGGPRDQTPPRVLQSQPAADDVNVETSSIRIAFSEYVDRASLARSLSVTPPLDGRFEFDWDGRAVEVEFPEALRDSTTYIVTLDTELQDTRGVSLEEPIQIAFATGPRINRGRIAGRVVGSSEGEPQPKVDIYAYAAPGGVPPDSLPDRPDYRTQTGSDGAFTLEYLREQPYYVIALSDANRNRQPDVLEPFATPPRPVLPGTAEAAPIAVPWVTARLDSIAPQLQRVQPRSNQRLTLRFSEPVRPSLDPTDYTLRDSTRAVEQPVASVFAQGVPTTSVQLLTQSPMQEGRHRLRVGNGTTDTLGTALTDTTIGFDATTQPDTATTRFVQFLPEGLSPDSAGAWPLLPGISPGTRFTQPVDTTRFGTAVTARDSLGQPRAFRPSTADGTNYRFSFDPPLAPDESVELAVDSRVFGGADTTFTRTVRRLTARSLGELEGRALPVDTSALPASDTSRGTASDTPLEDPTRSDTTLTDTTLTDTTLTDTTLTDTTLTDTTTIDPAVPDPTAPDTTSSDTTLADTTLADTVVADTIVADTSVVDTSAADTSGRRQAAEAGLRVTMQPVDRTRLAGPVVVELYATSATPPVAPRSQVVGADTTFLFEQLPEGTFRFRAFLDRNKNGRWDPGRLIPYEPAEPVTWSPQPSDSRPRWTTVLPAPLRIPVLARPLRIESDAR